jgi:hypothetical protein
MNPEDTGKDEDGESAGAPPLPPFEMLCLGLAAQAQIALGLQADPVTNETSRDLDAARQAIDLLGMLDEKTKGNLSADESDLLTHVLYDLRRLFVVAAGTDS